MSHRGPAAETARRRARRGEGEQLRQEIIDAATRLLGDRGGEEAVSIRAIADEVGVTPPSIYLHFADKEELFLAVCDDRFRELDRRSNEAAAAAGADPLARIAGRGEAYVRFGLENPEQYRILFMSSHRALVSPDQIKDWAAFTNLVADVEAAVAGGQLAGDPFVLAIGLWAKVHGLVSLLVTMPTFPWPPLEQLIGQLGGAGADDSSERC